MSGKRIKDLTAATIVADTDQLPIDGTGFSEAKKIAVGDLLSSAFGEENELVLPKLVAELVEVPLAFKADGGNAPPTISFFSGSSMSRQTITGSRGGNEALASLLTALANYGLITNSTTA